VKSKKKSHLKSGRGDFPQCVRLCALYNLKI